MAGFVLIDTDLRPLLDTRKTEDMGTREFPYPQITKLLQTNWTDIHAGRISHYKIIVDIILSK